MSDSNESTAAERAAGAARKAYVEGGGSLDSGGIEQRSLGDVLNNPYVAGAVVNAVTGLAGYGIGKLQSSEKPPPGKHEEPSAEE
jgi:hypothetical protein